MAATHHGQADDYYNAPQDQGYGQQQNGGYNQQYPPQDVPQQNGNQAYAAPQNMNQNYAPPQNMNQNYAPSQGQPQQSYGMEESKMSQQPPTYGQDFHQASGKQDFHQVFKVQKPKWNDLWAGILLVLVFLGFVGVSGYTLYKYSKFHSFSGGGIYNAQNDFSLNTNTIVLFAFVLAVGFVFSWAYFLLAQHFTKQFIWITGILNICLAVGTAVYYLYKHLWGAGIVFAIFAVFAIFCFISWIPRIPFAVVMLQTAMDVARHHGHVFLVSLLGGVAAVAFSAWFSITLVAVYVAFEPSNSSSSNGTNPACSGSCSSTTVIGLLVFITFAGYWISEWIKNTIHVTVAGVYGSWYFCSGKPGGMPKGATSGAFSRAMTYSFGSISFGSLIVALINMLRQACSIAQQNEAASGNMIGSMMFCCLGCFIGLLDWAVTFFNRYAFSHIALYGKAYIPAAKDTWKMMKDRGIDALVNDCLTGPVLTMGSLFVGYLSALLAYLYLEFTKPAYNQNNGTFTPVVMAFSFLIGLQICQIFMTPIGSGIDTLFVAMAWDPQVLVLEHPDLWQKLVQVYPHIQNSIHA